MKVCGIVCEYNPFHSGHLYHLYKTKELLGTDTAIICCMSGNFVQRGEPALLTKQLRAKAAVASGADLVVELPTAYTLLSAEGYAYASIYILDSMNIITDLSFGAETSDISVLCEIADAISEHDTVQDTISELKSGISYAAARERALYRIIKEKAEIISQPNNILGVEYLKALKRLGSAITPHAIFRSGACHDSAELSGENISASAIRHAIRAGQYDTVKKYLAPEMNNIFESDIFQGSALISTNIFTSNMYSYLLRLTPDDFRHFPDVSEGLEHRIFNALHSSSDIESAAMSVKTKRYALSRIRRTMLRAYLGLSSDLSSSPPPYCRVLAFNNIGQHLLSLLRKRSKIPILTKPSHVYNISDNAQKLFERESLCTDLYCSAINMQNAYLPGSEWRARPDKVF